MAREMLKPEGYDPLTYAGDLNITKHSLFGMFSLHEIMLIAAGALGLIGFFLPWLTYQSFGESRVLYGYSFTRDVEMLRPHPEVWLIPMVCVFFLSRSLFIAQLRKKTNLPLWPMMVMTFIFSFVLFAIPALIEVDADKLIKPVAGISFLNNAEAGWYLALSAGILSIVAACAALVEPFLSKHYTKKGSTARTAKFGFASVSQVMQPQPVAAMTGTEGVPSVPVEGAQAGAPSFDWGGGAPQPQQGYDQGGYGQEAWGGGADMSQMTPSKRKKYEKAMKKQQKEYQKRTKQQKDMWGGGPQF
jgi:hypothetical protein